MKKIVICGGHLTPALSVIEQLKKENIELIFIGRKHAVEGSKSLSSEFTKINSMKIKFLPIVAGRLQRRFTLYTLLSLIKLPIGLIQSLIYLAWHRPSVVVSFGSYLSTPIVISAWLLGIPSITHEQATKAGLANKINSIFTSKFFSAWPLKEVEDAIVIGNPIRKSVYRKTANDKKISQFLKNNKNIIYVTGGSLGAHAINKVIFETLPRLKNYAIIHQIGVANHAGDHDKATGIKKDDYLALPYISDEDIGAVLNNARLVISRSGANTIWELASLAKVAILIPLPIAGAKEQEYNAKILEAEGSAVIIHQNELTPDLLIKKIEQIFDNHQNYSKKANLYSKTLKTEAGEKLKEEILDYI